MNKCETCYQNCNSSNSLIKIQNKWYCQSCITKDKEIFDKLKYNGYWYNILKQFVKFELK